MSVGAAPNLSGGLWMGGMSAAALGTGNGNANAGAPLDCGSPGSACMGGDGSGGSPPGNATASNNGQAGGAYALGTGYQDFGMGQSSGGDGYASIYGQAVGSNPVGSPAPGCGCPPPPGGQNPAAPPTGPYGIGAYVENASNRIEGVPVTCSETGVTLPSTCSTDLTFNVPSDTETYHLTTPAGTYEECVSGGPMFAFLASSSTGTAGELIEIMLPRA